MIRYQGGVKMSETYEQLSLWGDAIVLNEPKQAEKPKIVFEDLTDADIDKLLRSSKTPLIDKLDIVKKQLDKYLGWRKLTTSLLTTTEMLRAYVDRAIANDILVIDTETNNSLDPTTCKLMGLCLYTPGENAVYVPVNHVDFEGKLLSGQVSEAEIKAVLETLPKSVLCVYHNAKFDYEVLAYTCGLDMAIGWDTMLGARLIDENESAGLKEQYKLHINPEQEKYSIKSLFRTVRYENVDPHDFMLYAATDADMTYQLYVRQKKIFDLPDSKGIKHVFDAIEMPAIKPFARMEMNGINIDLDYCSALNEKYHKKLKDVETLLNAELEALRPKIEAWRLTKEANAASDKQKSKSAQLEDPINLGSPVQLAILIYDVLKVKPASKKAPRGTGKDELTKIASRDNLKFCKYLLEYRKMAKMIDAFLNALPEHISPRDNKIHCKYGQATAATGRTSCTEPNFQQIPSKSTDIRCMFLASCPESDLKANDGFYEVDCDAELLTDAGWKQIGCINTNDRFSGCVVSSVEKVDGFYKMTLIDVAEAPIIRQRTQYVMVGSDFSQQEPRLLSMYSGDDTMINAYKNGRDLYATVGMKVYHNKYEDNLEHNADGTIYEDGKKRRKRMKTLLLGITYGMGVNAVAELIGSTKKEAQEIFDSFYKEFPKVKTWMDSTEAFAKKNGYVVDWAGRRRRLPNIQLRPFEAFYKYYSNPNPLLECADAPMHDAELDKYEKMAAETRGYDGFDDVKVMAAKRGIDIRAHTAQIAEAERQCVNARIQGGAASMTKLAMVRIFNDPEMNKMGFKLLINVHDELIGECPAKYAKECSERLSYLMRTTLDGICPVPFKCDATMSKRWYEEEFTTELKEEYEKLLKGNSVEDAQKIFMEENKGLPEDLRKQIF